MHWEQEIKFNHRVAHEDLLKHYVLSEVIKSCFSELGDPSFSCFSISYLSHSIKTNIVTYYFKVISHLIFSTNLCSRHYSRPCFIHEETEVQRGQITCPKCFSNYVEVSGNLAPKFTFVTIMLYGSMNLAQVHKW